MTQSNALKTIKSTTSTRRNVSQRPAPTFDPRLVLCCCVNSVKKLLTDALNKNQYLRRLELQQIKDIVECMYERTYQRGEYVIEQGEPGNHLFVLAGRSAPV